MDELKGVSYLGACLVDAFLQILAADEFDDADADPVRDAFVALLGARSGDRLFLDCLRDADGMEAALEQDRLPFNPFVCTPEQARQN